MKQRLFFLHLILILSFCSPSKGETNKIARTSTPTNKTVSIEVLPDSNAKYKLRVSVPTGFGIQREAPNRILLSGESGLQVVSADTRFQGETNSKKKDYFLYVKDMPIQLQGKGKLLLHGKVFYCDYSLNICKFEKVEKTVMIP
ncbi:MAG: hypothetical protein AAF518_19460 [Spirochaetota bacterium]